MFLEALALDLEKTQRAIASSCLFCVPQPRSLVADEALALDDLYSHFLTPAGTATDAHARRPGEYDTLNGKTVSIQGSHVHTGRGFDEKRKVRILLSETREIQHQDVTVLHLSRPLSGGIALPEDPNELDVATFRRFTAILRAFPENELVFYQLDETIAQVKKICRHNQFVNRYEQTLPGILQEEWEIAVDEILQAGSFENEESDEDRNGDSGRSYNSHLLQIQQVVECYLMEQLHDFIFPRVVLSCEAQDATLASVLYRMRHYSPEDFGIRKVFQCDMQEAVETLLDVQSRKTPLDMLLAFKSCIDCINDAITHNLKQHSLDLGRYQMTTDDILDQLLFVLVQAFNRATLFGSSSSSASGDAHSEDSSSSDQEQRTPDDTGELSESSSTFPIVAVLKYISDYHFINSNTTALGFTIANFQVAVEYFLLRAAHMETCRICLQSANDSLPCSQGILVSKCEAAFTRNLRDAHDVSELKSRAILESSLGSAIAGHEGNEEDDGGGGFKQLVIVGEWSSSSSDREEEDDDDDEFGLDAAGFEFVEDDSFTDSAADASSAIRVHSVRTQSVAGDGATITHVSAGQRFFAAVNDRGQLFTWGDRSGGRLGYTSAAGDARRQDVPRRVAAGSLDKCHVISVACGAFHTLATDVNGHVFAWGSNARGQLGFLTHLTTTTEPSRSTIVAAPTLVADLRGMYVSSVACGEYHSLALSSDGRVFSWGCNKYSKLGRVTESFADAVQPKALDELWTGYALDLKTVRGSDGDSRGGGSTSKSIVRRIAAGKNHSLAISFDGAAFTWGRGDSGQLGHGCFMDVARPKQVMALAGTGGIGSSDANGISVLDIAGGSDFSLFLVATGNAFVSGRDPSLAGNPSTLFPELVALPQAAAEQVVIGVSCGEAHFALQLSNGALLVSSGNSDSSRSEDDPSSASASESSESEAPYSGEGEDEPRPLKLRELELVGSLAAVARVACGGSHTLVLR